MKAQHGSSGFRVSLNIQVPEARHWRLPQLQEVSFPPGLNISSHRTTQDFRAGLTYFIAPRFGLAFPPKLFHVEQF